MNEKVLVTFKSLVGYPVTVHFRSSPELIIEGVFNSFSLEDPDKRVIVVQNNTTVIINWDDVALIRQTKQRRV